MDLTAVEPFRLGTFAVTPARGEIACGETIARVEPKVMAVLVALAQRQGETVSRERLIEDVWEGRAVTDDALTRCISALRRIFRESQGVEIKALPKLGYVLSVAATPQAAAAPGTIKAQPRTVWLGLGAVLALAVTAVLSFRATDPGKPADAKIVPMTAMPGLELYPALAPAGGQLAFAHRDSSGQWDLYVKSVAGGDPQRLTNDAAREQHPVWSSTGDEIAFVRRDGDACEIYRLAVPGGTPRKVVDCGAKLVQSLDWSPDGRLLALAVSDARLDPGRLAFVALTGEPPRVGLDPKLSVEDVRFAPDGKSIALTLSSAIGAEDVYTLALDGSGLKRITRDNAKVHGLAWSPDGRDVIYASNRAGSFGLQRVALSGGAPVALLPTLQDIENPTRAGTRVVYEAWTESGALKTLTLDATKRPPALPADSTRLEWHPDSAADGAIVFVSDRGGAPEVWIGKDGAVRQLTWFGDAYVHTPKFSPDGTRIAFSAPRDGHFNLFVVDREGKQRRLTQGPANDMSPAWSADGATLYFASDRQGGWGVWKLDVATGIAARVSNVAARAVYVASESELLIVDPAQGGLRRLDLRNPVAASPSIAELAPSDWANVTIEDGAAFYVRREPPDRAALRRLDLATMRDEFVDDLPDFYFRSGLTVTDGALIYAATKVEDVSLMLLDQGTAK